MALKIPAGLDGIPTSTIPDDPAAFVAWFKSVGVKRWLANSDVRNAIEGQGISITGDISTPATVAINDEIMALEQQSYLLVGNLSPPAHLTEYRTIAAEAGFITLTDGGALSTETIGIDQTMTPTWTGLHTFNGGVELASTPSETVGFYGTTPVAQRATTSTQKSTNVATSASFGSTQLAALQEVMNTLYAYGLWGTV